MEGDSASDSEVMLYESGSSDAEFVDSQESSTSKNTIDKEFTVLSPEKITEYMVQSINEVSIIYNLLCIYSLNILF